MRREQVKELHCIAPIENVPSILQRGLLSHNCAVAVPHVSVAREAVQSIRARKRVPGGRALHDYANLYFNARNPMMSVLRERHGDLCVLRVDPRVLDIPGTMITDRNAAVRGRIGSSPDALVHVDGEIVFAERWTGGGHSVPEAERKEIRCAETLVPDRVEPTYIRGAYVSSFGAGLRLARLAPSLPVTIHPNLFFQGTMPWVFRFALEACLMLIRKRSSTP